LRKTFWPQIKIRYFTPREDTKIIFKDSFTFKKHLLVYVEFPCTKNDVVATRRCKEATTIIFKCSFIFKKYFGGVIIE